MYQQILWDFHCFWSRLFAGGRVGVGDVCGASGSLRGFNTKLDDTLPYLQQTETFL